MIKNSVSQYVLKSTLWLVTVIYMCVCVVGVGVGGGQLYDVVSQWQETSA